MSSNEVRDIEKENIEDGVASVTIVREEESKTNMSYNLLSRLIIDESERIFAVLIKR